MSTRFRLWSSIGLTACTARSQGQVKNREANGHFLPGHSVGEATRWPPGTCPNPGGCTKLDAEYLTFKDRLFDPECRDAAFAALKKAVVKGEQWGVAKWFDLAVKILPQAPLELTVQADLTVSRKEYDAQLQYVTDAIARYAAGGRTADGVVEAGPGTSPLQLADVGETEPT